MTALTTRQRNLLRLLLDATTPLSTLGLADQLELTPRQVKYDLNNVRCWLEAHQAELKTTPGVGVEVVCAAGRAKSLAQELAGEANIQLILTLEQRQQLLALLLLTAAEPVILQYLQQTAQSSRSTILKDLDVIEAWIQHKNLAFVRRPNYGFQVEGPEHKRREALAALLWGEMPFGPSIFTILHTHGLIFALHEDANLLPLLRDAVAVLKRWDVKRALRQVAFAEVQLGGRFIDDAVLYLALTFAIQVERIESGHTLAIPDEALEWLQGLPIWPTAERIAGRLGWRGRDPWPAAEVASLVMHIMAAPRNDRWPGDLDINQPLRELVDDIMAAISQAYDTPAMSQDRTLRDGLVNNTIPACFRRRFDLWMPSSTSADLSENFIFEKNLAFEIAGLIEQRTDARLPEGELNNIVMLLRAARIREYPRQEREVLVVCPSGMATSQLLAARLKVFFPHLGSLRIISLRDLGTYQFASNALILTTVPLPVEIPGVPAIQVHPLLLPEDIEKITQWLA